jgi:EKC/KEOPS complex subunit CGI121/TPRKB
VIDATNTSTNPDPSSHLSASVEGDRIDFSNANLKDTADLPRLTKIYKLTPGADTPSAGKRGKRGRDDSSAAPEKKMNGMSDPIDQIKEMEAVILGTMALKGS